jgi:hypothetical protein
MTKIKRMPDAKIISDLHGVCKKREMLKTRYGTAEDEDIIEAIIYEDLALNSRYNYLLKVARENDVKLDRKCFFLNWEHR